MPCKAFLRARGVDNEYGSISKITHVSYFVFLLICLYIYIILWLTDISHYLLEQVQILDLKKKNVII